MHLCIYSFYSGDYTLSISKYTNGHQLMVKKNDSDKTTVTSQSKQVFHSGTEETHRTAVTSDLKNILNCCT
jgi:hypothetical protein